MSYTYAKFCDEARHAASNCGVNSEEVKLSSSRSPTRMTTWTAAFPDDDAALMLASVLIHNAPGDFYMVALHRVHVPRRKLLVAYYPR